MAESSVLTVTGIWIYTTIHLKKKVRGVISPLNWSHPRQETMSGSTEYRHNPLASVKSGQFTPWSQFKYKYRLSSTHPLAV